MQRRLPKNKRKSADIKVSPPYMKKRESITPQDQTSRVKKIVVSRFSPWVNEVSNRIPKN